MDDLIIYCFFFFVVVVVVFFFFFFFVLSWNLILSLHLSKKIYGDIIMTSICLPSCVNPSVSLLDRIYSYINGWISTKFATSTLHGSYKTWITIVHDPSVWGKSRMVLYWMLNGRLHHLMNFNQIRYLYLLRMLCSCNSTTLFVPEHCDLGQGSNV